jgi:hypothetical protein
VGQGAYDLDAGSQAVPGCGPVLELEDKYDAARNKLFFALLPYAS